MDLPELIPVGDPVRVQLRRAIYATLGLAFLFSLSTAPVKQSARLYSHAPWLNDPFDTVISFTMFFVPFVAVCCCVRVLLCRRNEELSMTRARDILRGCRVMLGVITFTLATEWSAVALGSNRQHWNWATDLQLVALAFLTLVTIVTSRLVSRKELRAILITAKGPLGPDLLADVVSLSTLSPRNHGTTRRLLARFTREIDERVGRFTRRHPVWSAVTLWGTFSLAVGLRQSLHEGYGVSATFILVILLFGGMFGWSLVVGKYLGLVQSQRPLGGAPRRFLESFVATCVGVLIPFAFRYHLWWVVDSNNRNADMNQLVGLLSISAIVIFAATYGVETLLRATRHPTSR